MTLFVACSFICLHLYMLQIKFGEENGTSVIKCQLFELMSEVCDILGRVSVDDWLSMPDKVSSTIQRLLLRRSFHN